MDIPLVLKDLIAASEANGAWASVTNILSNEDDPMPEDCECESDILTHVALNMTSLADEANRYLFDLLVLAHAPIQPMNGDPADEAEPSMWDEHRDFPLEDWEYEVRNGDTRQGYWMWVASKIEERQTDGTNG